MLTSSVVFTTNDYSHCYTQNVLHAAATPSEVRGSVKILRIGVYKRQRSVYGLAALGCRS